MNIMLLQAQEKAICDAEAQNTACSSLISSKCLREIIQNFEDLKMDCEREGRKAID